MDEYERYDRKLRAELSDQFHKMFKDFTWSYTITTIVALILLIISNIVKDSGPLPLPPNLIYLLALMGFSYPLFALFRYRNMKKEKEHIHELLGEAWNNRNAIEAAETAERKSMRLIDLPAD